MLTPTKWGNALEGVNTFQSSISFGRCWHPVLTPSVDTYQSGYHLGRCQHWVSTLGVNTYLKEGAGWVTLHFRGPWLIFLVSTPKCLVKVSHIQYYTFYIQLAPLGGISGPLKSELGVFWPFRAIFFLSIKYSYSIFSKPSHFPILIFWILNLHIIMCQFKKKSIVTYLMSLTACSCHSCQGTPPPVQFNFNFIATQYIANLNI